MSLAQRFAARQVVNMCPVATAAAQLDESEREALYGLIDLRGKGGDYMFRPRTVSEDIRAEGVDIKEAAVLAHRNGTCGCESRA